MNATVTYNSVALALSYQDANESKRQSTARGVNTPDVLTIRHQDGVDSTNKVPMRRHVIRLDSHQVDSTDSLLFKSSAYAVIEVSARATTAQIDSLVATFRAAIANTTAGSDVIAAVLNNEG